MRSFTRLTALLFSLVLLTSLASSAETYSLEGDEGIEFIGDFVTKILDDGVTDEEFDTLGEIVVCYLDDEISNLEECMSEREDSMPILPSEVMDIDIESPEEPESVESAPGDWVYIETTDICSETSSFQEVDIGGQEHWYFCEEGNEEAWRISCVEERAETGGECLRDGHRFSIEAMDEAGEYELEILERYTVEDVSDNLEKKETEEDENENVYSFEAYPGEEYWAEVSGEDYSGVETLSFEAPAIEVEE